MTDLFSPSRASADRSWGGRREGGNTKAEEGARQGNAGLDEMAKAGDGKSRSNKRRRTGRLTKRVTHEELQEFQIRASESGFENAQDYLTAFVKGDIRLRAASRKDAIKALGALGKIGSNINQIAKAANEGRIKHLDACAVAMIENSIAEIEGIGRKIREAL